MRRGAPRPGLETGFDQLDGLTGGLRGLAVLGGLRKIGKTTLALQLACEVARRNVVPVLVACYEMTGEQLVPMFRASYSGVSRRDVELGGLDAARERVGRPAESSRRKRHSAGSRLARISSMSVRVWPSTGTRRSLFILPSGTWMNELPLSSSCMQLNSRRMSSPIRRPAQSGGPRLARRWSRLRGRYRARRSVRTCGPHGRPQMQHGRVPRWSSAAELVSS